MHTPPSRREFLQWAVALGAAPAAFTGTGAARARVRFADTLLTLEFDERLHTRVRHTGGAVLSEFAPAEALAVEDLELTDFAYRSHTITPCEDHHGVGRTLTLEGVGARGIVKLIEIRLYERYPGFACYRVAYRHEGTHAQSVRGWRGGQVALAPAAGEPEFCAYSGASYEDRRDWVLRLKEGQSQPNFLGMNATDYGGGMPIVDVWQREAGLAVGHLASVPRLLALPLARRAHRAHIAIAAAQEQPLAPGARFETGETFLAVHTGDHFAVLDAYRRLMGERGLASPVPPAGSFEGIWCAWGYERQCTPALIEGTLAKVRELGLRWAVIDDGWQKAIGDWWPDPAKYPGGVEEFKRLAAHIKDAQLRPRLWVTPIAVAPGSDLLHEHADMLLLDANGGVQNISWWNSFYLCPAYDKTLEYVRALTRRWIGEWGFEGLKIDGQQLNGVAPCYNPAHHHARPEESIEGLANFYRAIYDTAREINPEAVLELCPCGTAYSFFNLPYMNQAPASDPESSWQVRLKGKSLKALMGPNAAFAGDHVELSDGGEDFASTVGIGAVVSTKFTWPVDPKPKDSFLLTPEREARWRHWIGLYNEHQLPRGQYRGALYDIGFDRPEAHAIECEGVLYYAFYAPAWRGRLELRGLEARAYRVRDYVNGRELGTLAPGERHLEASFEHALLLEARPA